MPVKSYLVFPENGEMNNLANQLTNMEWCEVTPSTNKEVLVLVTDTANEKEEEKCLSSLNEMTNIKHYTLVSGFDETEN